MLINKSTKIEAGDIITLKLANGDEIVGELVSESDYGFLLNRPMAAVMTGQGLGLMQAMFSVDPKGKYEISKNHVMMHGQTFDTVKKHYLSSVSDIAVLTKGDFRH